MLSLPLSSKRALFMGLHPRVGADSPLRTLLQAEEPRKIFRRIFDFLECSDLASIKCLVFCHCPQQIHAGGIRDVMLRHMDILRHWRTTPNVEANVAQETTGLASINEGSAEEKEVPSGATPAAAPAAAQTSDTAAAPAA